jgi:hypothetical protein
MIALYKGIFYVDFSCEITGFMIISFTIVTMNKTKSFVLALLIPLQLFQWNCSRQTPAEINHNGHYTAWDTSFGVNGISFSDTAIIARSIVSKGNNYRLWKFIDKLRSGAAVRIGFIGGSITAGAGVSSIWSSYCGLFCTFTERLYPESRVEQINAGIGATNSRFACSRARDDLLSKSPDLIVIEFGVNDDPLDSVGTTTNMEGLVRQCMENPDVPVMMLFLMNRSGDTIDQSLHSLVGNHYGIPLISYRNVCWPLVAGGQLAPDSIFFDAIHPNSNGHLICAYLLFSFLRQTIQENARDPSAAVPTPLFSDIYEYAGIMKTSDTVSTVDHAAGWKDTVRELDRIGFYSLHPQDSLTISSKAREFTLGYHYSMDHSARVEIILDGTPVDTVSNFFAADWGGGKLMLQQVYIDPAGPGNHVLSFINLDNDLFTIEYLLFSR